MGCLPKYFLVEFTKRLLVSDGSSWKISADNTFPKIIMIRLEAPFNFFCPMEGYAVVFFEAWRFEKAVHVHGSHLGYLIMDPTPCQ